ncbi:MAG TPA: penicillin-binding protein 2 [Caulobacteraceae bacterium]|jgi:penicillin-binding protein 2|nr:penicillin-binding protein 2 [Caulobacteraceae bacterium]
MSRSPLLLDEVNERQASFTRRTILFGGVVGGGLVALGGRLTQLQVLEAGKYRLLSEHNQFEFQLTPPPRGLVLDRNGVVLASNRPDFRLLLAKDETVDVDQVLSDLAALIDIEPARLRRLKAEIETAPRHAPVAIVEDMSWEDFSRVNVRAPELPGITADMGEVRVYPFSAAFSHVVGYVAKVSARDVSKTGPNADPILLNPGFRIGKQGVEKAYDLQLRGKPGARKVEVDVKGRVVRQYPGGNLPATPGSPIRLTIDADIQTRAMEVFGEESGAAVMMDCRSGDVLCLFSAPSFDANGFVKGLSGPDYRALAEYERKPLFNKALTATYPPGSTFKTMVALAALEKGVEPSRTYTCAKHWFWGGRSWGCDKAHGTLDLKAAIAQSCDIYFYQLALSLGPDPIAAVARGFGLGALHEIGIPGQKKGLVPDTAYKRRAFPRDPVWHPGETPSLGIGQGYMSVNALQLCVQAARLANGKVALEPRLVQSIDGLVQASNTPPPALPYAPAHLEFIREAMADVVTHGTAARFAELGLGPVRMAGKTGTAQAHNYAAGTRGAHGAHGAWQNRDHAWFIAFAPYDDPRYAMSVLVEHGGFGADAAAPKAAEIMKVALLKDPAVRARVTAV